MVEPQFPFWVRYEATYKPPPRQPRMVQKLKCGRRDMLCANPGFQFWAYGTPLARSAKAYGRTTQAAVESLDITPTASRGTCPTNYSDASRRLPSASMARRAANTLWGVTGTGSLWMVSPSAQALALLGSCREPPQWHTLNHPLRQR
jgi:hypothetical protein